jgi:hypothetical protein
MLVKRLVGGDDMRGEFVAPGVWCSVEGGSGDDIYQGSPHVPVPHPSDLVVEGGVGTLVKETTSKGEFSQKDVLCWASVEVVLNRLLSAGGGKERANVSSLVASTSES